MEDNKFINVNSLKRFWNNLKSILDNKQNISDDNLLTNNKSIVSAINEIYNKNTFQESMLNITYSELKSLKDNDGLIPGLSYRIIDYVTTTNGLYIGEENCTVQSAEHKFDVIVTAISTNTLSEDAKVCYNESDDYFKNANANLSAWKIKYELNNYTTKYAWADENGTGVIYYMKDEWNNECYYDFKNIKFKRYLDITHNKYVHWNNSVINENADTSNYKYFYTFSLLDADSVCFDTSLNIYTNKLANNSSEKKLNVENNSINKFTYNKTHILNDIIWYCQNNIENDMLSSGIKNLIIDNNTCNISLYGDIYNIHAGNDVYDIILCGINKNIKIGNDTNNIFAIHGISNAEIKQNCHTITSVQHCNDFIIGNNNKNVSIDGCYNFTIDDNCTNYNISSGCNNFKIGSYNNWWKLQSSNVDVLPSTIYPNGETPETHHIISLQDSYSRQLIGLSQNNKIITITQLKNAYQMLVLTETDVILNPGIYNIWLKTYPTKVDFSNTIYGSEIREYILSFLITTTNASIEFDYPINWCNEDEPDWENGYRYEVSVMCYNNRGYATYNKFKP